MDKDAIISLLKQINYPGYNRDIVSFGIVNEINKFDVKNIDIRASSSAINEKMLENLKNF